uniref:Uncharacterized protein n=1 Tax=Tanacetum cinerariifolium TaxID=118510 RepID=A0A6L2J933_TANCI|nr:hypothetical protein [Tanacetum cinerariifolium]
MVISTTKRTLCGAGWMWWCDGVVMMKVGMAAAVGGVVAVTRGGGDVTAVVTVVVAWMLWWRGGAFRWWRYRDGDDVDNGVVAAGGWPECGRNVVGAAPTAGKEREGG